MSEFISNFHFIRPWYLLLLLPVVAMGWKFLRYTPNKSSWEKVCDKKLLEFLLVKGSSSLRKFVTYLTAAGLIFSIIAISGPAWKKKEVPTLSSDNPVMI
ncbi:MAG: hypothetical protein LBL47_04765, partial [Lactobacillus sp.]|nr:hypothetical protein [Lactobacillus sp.]